jgi:hypothetical protein
MLVVRAGVRTGARLDVPEKARHTTTEGRKREELVEESHVAADDAPPPILEVAGGGMSVAPLITALLGFESTAAEVVADVV